MQIFFRHLVIVGVATLVSVASPVFAESAPVFDADSMQQAFENDNGASSQEGAFVPPQQPAAEAKVASSEAAPASSSSTSQRLRRLEQQLNNMQSGESSARLDSLQDQVQSLRGQVEQLTHQVQQMQTQQKTLYTDLDKRLSQQEAKPNKKPGVSEVSMTDNGGDTDDQTTSASKPRAKIALAKQSVKATAGVNPAAEADKKSLEGQPNVAEEQQIYQTAYNLIKSKKYNEAVNALQSMLKKYPSGQFASNAHYWLGELYGLMGKNDLALNEFGTVVQSYPDSPRISDAQLKVGLIYATQSKWADAKSAFKSVVNRYPGTASARVASEQLKQIKIAGH